MGANLIERCAQFIKVIIRDIDMLAVIFGKHGLNVATVEVLASDVAFDLNVVCVFSR